MSDQEEPTRTGPRLDLDRVKTIDEERLHAGQAKTVVRELLKSQIRNEWPVRFDVLEDGLYRKKLCCVIRTPLVTEKMTGEFEFIRPVDSFREKEFIDSRDWHHHMHDEAVSALVETLLDQI